jgi:serine O-acetyltransferase
MSADSQSKLIDSVAPAVDQDKRGADELSLRELLLEDFITHGRLWLEPGLWAVAAHRLGTRAGRVASPVVRKPLLAA